MKAGIELERLSRRLLTLQEDERRRIARELHDDYGQRMASLLFELAAAAERTDATPDLRLAIQNAGEHLGNVAKDLQQLSRSLHSAVLDKIGLEAAIRSDCNSLRQRTRMGGRFRVGGCAKTIAGAAEPGGLSGVSGGLAECLKAFTDESVERFFDCRRSGLDASGQGLWALGLTRNRRNRTGGLGLLSMRERLRMVGGALAIHSEVGKGTQVKARLPMVSATG